MITGMFSLRPRFSYQLIMQVQMLLQHSTKSGSGMSISPLGHLPVSAYAIEMRAYAHRSLLNPSSPSACSSSGSDPPLAEIAAAWLSGYTVFRPSVVGISCGKLDAHQPIISPAALASAASRYTSLTIFASTLPAGSFSAFSSVVIVPFFRYKSCELGFGPPRMQEGSRAGRPVPIRRSYSLQV